MSKLLIHLCQLARLQLSDEERIEFSRKFEKLLCFIESIREFPIPDGASNLHVPKERQPLRADTVSKDEAQDTLAGPYAAGQISALDATQQ